MSRRFISCGSWYSASMRCVLNEEERRMTPWTSYPFSSSSSARYEPSCPVMPVMSARLRVTIAPYASGPDDDRTSALGHDVPRVHHEFRAAVQRRVLECRMRRRNEDQVVSGEL